ncbi:MAG TPA: NAD(P)-dependent oxidoreductase [Thermoplasmata archaeon]|nr:NAD(P)-dependent oxidoreductase [Thermoplasmata archaeon]HXQ79392.1 NAD(P)-dependent oxidoreductase [Thermoplasmata archaeon]
MAQSQLLVSLPPEEEISTAITRHLVRIPWEYVGPSTPGPWPEARAMLVGDPGREIPGWTFAQTPRLEFVQRLWTGLDRFPFARFPPSVRVSGNVGAFAPAVGEHAVTLLLALAQDVRGDHERVREGQLGAVGRRREIRGSTLLLLGFGEIATEVAQRLKPFGVRIEGVVRSTRAHPLVERMFPASSLREAVRGADLIVDCRPLTLATKGTIDEALLRSMKPKAIYVNVGRAATVDEEALFRHLSTHPEFRAGMDVWWEEEHTRDRIHHRFPFPELPNFLGSPHNAAESADTGARGLSFAIDNLARFFSGETPRHVANRRDYVSE